MKEAQDLDVDNRVLSLENQSIARKEYSNKLLNDDKKDNDNSNSNINNEPSWLKQFDNDLKYSINDDVNRIMSKNNSLLEKKGLSYDSKNNVFFDTKTGEVVDINSHKDKVVYSDFQGSIVISKTDYDRIMQNDFDDYNGPLQLYENDFLRESRDTFNEEYRNGEYL